MGCRKRPYPHIGERGEALGEIIKRNLEVPGWLEHFSGGLEWSSPPFTVPRPVPPETPVLDNWRLVIDFCYFNSQTEDDQAHLPLIEDTVERHEPHKIFWVLDLKHGFHQMPLHPDDRRLMAMPTPLGTLVWKVLPMGVKNGPAQFQRHMDWILTYKHGPQDEKGKWTYIYSPLKQASKHILTTLSSAPQLWGRIIRLSRSIRSGYVSGGFFVAPTKINFLSPKLNSVTRSCAMARTVPPRELCLQWRNGPAHRPSPSSAAFEGCVIITTYISIIMRTWLHHSMPSSR